MYLSAKSLHYIITTIIQEAGKLSDLPYSENLIGQEININHNCDARLYHFCVHLRRMCVYQENRVLVAVCRGRLYPRDFIEVIKDENRYHIVAVMNETRKRYSHLSLKFIQDSVMVNELVDDFLAHVLDSRKMP